MMTLEGNSGSSAGERRDLELGKLELENKKLHLELAALQRPDQWDRWLGRLVPIITAFVAAGGFLLGVQQFIKQSQDAERAELARRTEADKLFRREVFRETTNRFLEKQVRLYLDAAETAATIAASDDAESVKKSTNHFWALYWGPLAAVEDVGLNRLPPGQETTPIESAMVRFGRGVSGEDKCDRDELHRRALQLAHHIRDAIRPAFEELPVTDTAGQK
jgi:hypothetical protein